MNAAAIVRILDRLANAIIVNEFPKIPTTINAMVAVEAIVKIVFENLED